MKYIFKILLSIIFINGYSQNLTVNDLILLNQLKKIEHAKYFLTKYKEFSYSGNFGFDENGWELFKFYKGNNIIEVGTAKVEENNENFELINIRYYIYDIQEYNLFLESLKKNNFFVKENGVFDNGVPFSIWTGTLTLSDSLTLIGINKEEGVYIVTII